MGIPPAGPFSDDYLKAAQEAKRPLPIFPLPRHLVQEKAAGGHFLTLLAAFSWQVEMVWADIHQSFSHMALSAAVGFHSRGQMVLCEARSDDWPDSHVSSLLFDQLVSQQTTSQPHCQWRGHMLLGIRTDRDFIPSKWRSIFLFFFHFNMIFKDLNVDLNLLIFNITRLRVSRLERGAQKRFSLSPWIVCTRLQRFTIYECVTMWM